MKKTALLASLALAGMLMTTGAAQAQDACTADPDEIFDLDDAAVNALYDCVRDRMAEGYAKSEDPVGSEYRSWTATATRPAVEGAHGERFLLTFANDVAAEQYLKFEEEGVQMPVGSVLAKESFKVRTKGNNKGKLAVGPLFLMTKVGLDEAPETAGWLYGGIQPNGKPMKFKQSFCHNCHTAWEAQDSLAYPVEDVRVSTGG